MYEQFDKLGATVIPLEENLGSKAGAQARRRRGKSEGKKLAILR